MYYVSVAVDRGDPSKGTPADPDLTDEQFREVAKHSSTASAWMRAGGRRSHDGPGESHAHIVATWRPRKGVSNTRCAETSTA